MMKALRGGALVAVVLALTACATAPEHPGRVVDRLPERSLPPPPPALPPLGLEDLIRLAGQKVAAEGIILRLQESRTRLRLSATDVLTLSAKGVPLAVIDHLLDSDRRAALDECSERINRLERDQAAKLQHLAVQCRQQCDLACPSFGWPGYPSPYWRRWP